MNFVHKNSIVREIWGNADTILFIFGGAAAEFSLNKAVDWLYFTGKLPADPLGRLFSTVVYAQQIIFSDERTALAAIDKITAIHQSVEQSRGMKIPDWAYRDVLFMLIHYSISAFELLERKLTDAEKEEIFDVFNRVGERMGLENLPKNHTDWLVVREQHLQENLLKSAFTDDLYKQYRKHLGVFRYLILWEGQKLVVPLRARNLLSMSRFSVLKPFLLLYKFTQKIKFDKFLKQALLPPDYAQQIMALDRMAID
ncbi:MULTISPECIES: oxygenase MpaB family protein [Emticicia]|uniref:oxygenase MpaB family protein n=1 Tax=Emticicia TaxID=312278 RepID=UPI0007D8A9F9|nr:MULTISPECIES: oxygenase MpaB family protein [Emticicia]